MQILGFHHLAIQVRSLEQMAVFYHETLGLTELARHHRPDGTLRSVWVAIPGGFLALEEVEGEPAAEGFQTARPGLFLVALRIDAASRATVREELVQKGVAIDHESQWTLYIRDPEGNRVGLSHFEGAFEGAGLYTHATR
jgi:catechol-2,3-dioxygenase